MLATVQKIDADTLNVLQTQVCWHDLEIDTKQYHSEIIKVVEKFSTAMASKGQSGSYYSDNRNASTPLNDIRIGKFAEYAVCMKLRLKGFPKIMPDIEIRTGFRKGWDCDLPFKEFDIGFPNCHVKTCSQKTSDFAQRATGDKYTWTFQFSNVSGNGGRDNLFNEPNSNELILFMFVPDVVSQKATLVASAPWSKLRRILKDPIVNKLKGLKKCIYSNDLIELMNSKAS
jgi:hypothetical protein